MEASFGEAPCHLVGHSLGGVLAVRLKARAPGRVARIVTLGAPLAGSPAAGRARALTRGLGPLSARARLGPSLDRLARGEAMVPPLPAEAAAEVLCVAGVWPLRAAGAVLGLTPPDDGRVERASAWALTGAARRQVRAEHAWPPLSLSAGRAAEAFLRDGGQARVNRNSTKA